jgi:SAM-dependent methyltransferase
MATIFNPKKGTRFFRFRNRLALFQEPIDLKDYWKKYWENSANRLHKEGEAGYLDEYEKPFTKYIDKSLPALEAGCGPAQLVLALQKRGYKATGIDYEKAVVDYTKSKYTDLDVREGDVTSLDFPDSHFGAYISLGVVEHFIDGPRLAIKESVRVLVKDRGVAFITIPYLNPRRSKYFFKEAKDLPSETGLTFHQYYYPDSEFRGYLVEAGYTVVDTYPYAVSAFLTREHPFFTRLWPRLPVRIKKPLLYFFHRAPMFFRRKYGHMIMYICKPTVA